MRFRNFLQNFSFRLVALCGIGMVLLSVVAGFTIEDLLQKDKLELTKAEVETARSIVATYDRRSRQGEFSQEQAQEFAKSMLRSIRYAGDEYVFVMDFEGIGLVLGDRLEREGTYLAKTQDTRGFDFTKSFIEKAWDGGGHTYYYYPKPGSDEPLRKVSYTLLYEPWGWVIGSGVYIEDVEAKFWHVMRTFALIAGGIMLAVSILAYFASRQLLFAQQGKLLAEEKSQRLTRLASVGQLAAGIAHEINTPAQYVSDNLHFLKDAMIAMLQSAKNGTQLPDNENDIMSEDISAAVRDGLEGIERISKIVRSMKEFSQSGASEMKDVDINKALENALTLSQNVWKTVAEVERRFDLDLPLVTCYGCELNQVFLNLILNAAEAIQGSGKGLPGHILVESFRNSDGVVVRVSDDGPGIPEDLRQRIFDPFFTTKPFGQNLGQGLAFSKDVIELKHAGRLEVAGEFGKGAVFTVRLPYRPRPY